LVTTTALAHCLWCLSLSMSGYSPLALVLAACCLGVAAMESPVASCGMTASPDCLNDMGSCGNACCAAEFPSSLEPASLFDTIRAHLKTGGTDGLFNYTGGSGGLNLATPEGPWTTIFQGTHTTFKQRYVDTINFAIRKSPQGGSMVRIFSISDVAGALGDAGQNRRTVALLGSKLGLGPMAVLFGCGASPSLPAVSTTGEMWKATALSDPSVAGRNQEVIAEHFRGGFSDLLLMLVALCGVFVAGVAVGAKFFCNYPKSEPLLAAA